MGKLMIKTTVHHVVQAASPLTYGASAVAVVAGLTVSEWLAAAGLMVAIATFVVNWIYKQKTLKHIRSK